MPPVWPSALLQKEILEPTLMELNFKRFQKKELEPFPIGKKKTQMKCNKNEIK